MIPKRSSEARIVPAAEAVARARRWRDEGSRVIAAGGTFDLLHSAHARWLEAARRRGDRLVVLVYGDHDAAARLGSGRPVMDEAERAQLVAALRAVDLVTVAEGASSRTLVEALEAVEWLEHPEDRGSVDRDRLLRIRGSASES